MILIRILYNLVLILGFGLTVHLLLLFLMRFMNTHQLQKVLVVLQFFEGALLDDLSFFHEHDLINEAQEIDSVGYEDACLVLEFLLEHFFEYFLLDVGVESRDRVVHENQFVVLIDCPRQAYSGFLPSAEVDSFLSNFGLVAGGQNFQIPFQLAYSDCPLVSLAVVRVAE